MSLPRGPYFKVSIENNERSGSFFSHGPEIAPLSNDLIFSHSPMDRHGSLTLDRERVKRSYTLNFDLESLFATLYNPLKTFVEKNQTMTAIL